MIDRWDRLGEVRLVPIRAARVALSPWMKGEQVGLFIAALTAPIRAGPDPVETAYQEAQEWAGEVKP